MKYVLLILTSKGCGHCMMTRGDGKMGNGKEYMTPGYIKTLLRPVKGNDSIHSVINIHYENMSGILDVVGEVSTFEMKGEEVQQCFYFQEDGKVKRLVIDEKGKTDKNVLKDSSEYKEWKTFVRELIPQKLTAYTYYYPCFVIFEMGNWNTCINDQKVSLVGITDAGKTEKFPDGSVGLSKDQEAFNSRRTSPQNLVANACRGTLKLEPHILPSEKKERNPEFVTRPYNDHFW